MCEFHSDLSKVRARDLRHDGVTAKLGITRSPTVGMIGDALGERFSLPLEPNSCPIVGLSASGTCKY